MSEKSDVTNVLTDMHNRGIYEITENGKISLSLRDLGLYRLGFMHGLKALLKASEVSIENFSHEMEKDDLVDMLYKMSDQMEKEMRKEEDINE